MKEPLYEVFEKTSMPKKEGVPWNKNKHVSEETRARISAALKGKPKSEETRKKMREAARKKIEDGVFFHPNPKGKHLSNETKKRMSETRKHLFAEGIIIPPWLGKRRSAETKKKISNANKGENHPLFGKHRSNETKIKIGIASLGRRHSEETKKKISKSNSGDNSYNFGKHLSEAVKQKISLANLGKPKSTEAKLKMSKTRKRLFIENILVSPTLGRRHSEETKKKMSEKRLKRVFPRKDTNIEKILQLKLTELNVSYEKHKPIIGQPDIFINPNICIFADGCYWHGCEECGFGNGKERDKAVTETLQKQGYVVLRFWEHDINIKPDFCILQIINILKNGCEEAVG